LVKEKRPTKKFKILVIDDDICIRETLMMALELEGYSVDTAENGKVAIEKSFANFYNLAIVDWRLPDIEGTKLIGQLKETTPRMPKIMLTGYPSMNNAVDAVNKRADAFILKPADFEDLLKKVKELLEEQEKNKDFSEERVANFIETRTKEKIGTTDSKKTNC
jgi:heterodisulfide reductase subunit A2